MKETMNEWRKRPETWTNSLQTLNDMRSTQERHQGSKSRFNTMLFQLFGNKSLVDFFVRFPICSAAQPAPLLRSFAQAWQSFRSSPEADRAQENSRNNMPGEVRLSKQIYALQQRRARGQWIAEWIVEDWNNWYKLDHADQLLWTEYTNGDISRKLTELQMEQRPRFPGAAEIIASRMPALSPPP
jgi:hypothetical protein